MPRIDLACQRIEVEKLPLEDFVLLLYNFLYSSEAKRQVGILGNFLHVGKNSLENVSNNVFPNNLGVLERPPCKNQRLKMG